MNSPLVSALISTYNSSKFIRGRLDDLIAQTLFKSVEIIIINSGSVQDEDSIIKEYLNEYNNIKYLSTNERETIYQAWNRGIRLANGRFITNANTDDRLKNNALEILVDFIYDHPSVALVYADQYISHIPNQNFDEIIRGKRTYRPKYSRKKLYRGYLAGSQSLWRKSLHSVDNIYFNESFEVAGDYDFICRVAEKYDVKKLNKILGVYYKSEYKSNKEDQNLSLTHFEAANVKDNYGRRFINSLSMSGLKKLHWQLTVLTFIPGKFWGLINRISSHFFPGYFTIDKIYICWLISLIEERKKNYKKAVKVIERYKVKDESQLIKLQLSNLFQYEV